MNKFKSVILALTVCVIALFSTGCSGLYVSQTTSNNSISTYQVSFEISKATVYELQTLSNGYSLARYFEDLCSVSGMTGILSETTDGYSFIASISESKDWLGGQKSTTVQDGLFFKTVKVKMENPLARLYEKYKDGTAQLKPGTAESVVYYITYGKTENGVQVLKPFTEAFGVDKTIFDGVVLNYLLQKRWGMSTETGKRNLLLYGDAYCYSVNAGQDGMVEFTYLAPIGWHWYTLIAVLGILVAVVLLIVNRKHAKKVGALEDCRQIERLRLVKNYTDNLGVPFSMDYAKKASNVVVFEEDERNDQDCTQQNDEQLEQVDATEPQE